MYTCRICIIHIFGHVHLFLGQFLPQTANRKRRAAAMERTGQKKTGNSSDFDSLDRVFSLYLKLDPFGSA